MDHPDPIRIECFGPLRATWRGRETVFAGTNRGALLAYLVLHAGHPQPRDTVAAALWPDIDSGSGRHRLRQEVSALRRQCDEAGIPLAEGLDATRDTLVLDGARFTADVLDHRRLAREARLAADPSHAESLLRAATALYREPFLPAFDQPWIETTRDLLRHEQAALLERLAERQSARGDADAARDTLERLVRHDPLREESHLHLMRLHDAAGHPARAVRQYQTLETLLRSQLGVPPSRPLRDAYDAIRSRLPAPPPPSPLPDPLPKTVPTPPPARRRPTPAAVLALGGALLAMAVAVVRLTPKPPRAAAALHVVWETLDHPRDGELPDAEPTALAPDTGGGAYLTGFTKTVRDDVDILVQRYAPDGRQLWSRRYSSPEHDADRAFVVAGDPSGVTVAGETYVPARPGVPEGWRIVVLRYDPDGALRWVRRLPPPADNADHRIRLVSDRAGGWYVGGTARTPRGTRVLAARLDGDGVVRWLRTAAPPGADEAQLRDMVQNREGLLVVGKTRRDTAAGNDGDDALALGITPDGALAWTHVAPDPDGGADSFDAIRTNVNEHVTAMGTATVSDAGTVFTASRFGPGGKPLWTRTLPESGPRFVPVSLVCNEVSTLFATGYQIAPDGTTNPWTACLDVDGNRRWVRTIPPQNGMGAGVNAIVQSGETFWVVGTFHRGFQPKDTEAGVLLSGVRASGEAIGTLRHHPRGHVESRTRAVMPLPDGLLVATQTVKGSAPTLCLTRFRNGAR